jgi:hypothetical protein
VETSLPETRDLYYPSAPQRVVIADRSPGTAIGKDLEAQIVVLDSGTVITLRDRGEITLINSSLQQYRDSLKAVGETRDLLNQDPDQENLVSDLAHHLQAIDPAAWAEPSSYWRLIHEQIRDELF